MKTSTLGCLPLLILSIITPVAFPGTAYGRNDCSYVDLAYVCPRENVHIEFKNESQDPQYQFRDKDIQMIVSLLDGYMPEHLVGIHYVMSTPTGSSGIIPARVTEEGIAIPVTSLETRDAQLSTPGYGTARAVARHMWRDLMSEEERKAWAEVRGGQGDEDSFAFTYEIWTYDTAQVLDRAVYYASLGDPTSLQMDLFIASYMIRRSPASVRFFGLTGGTKRYVESSFSDLNASWDGSTLKLGSYVFDVLGGCITFPSNDYQPPPAPACLPNSVWEKFPPAQNTKGLGGRRRLHPIPHPRRQYAPSLHYATGMFPPDKSYVSIESPAGQARVGWLRNHSVMIRE